MKSLRLNKRNNNFLSPLATQCHGLFIKLLFCLWQEGGRGAHFIKKINENRNSNILEFF